jgi:FRG domain
MSASDATSRTLVPLEPFSSWASLKDRLRDEREWIYRGQRCANWRLETTLERTVPADRRLKSEQELLSLYRQAINNYLSVGQIPKVRVDWLASMQHHGTPTRMLDFTRSPYVATYFAVEDAAGDEPCVVWAIDEVWCGRRADSLLKASGVVGAHDDATHVWRWLYLNQNTWAVARLVAPAGMVEMTHRQVAQQSLFAVPGDLSCSFEDNLASTSESEADLREHVKCYQIPADRRGEVLRDLRLMNITRASLFPGLDGFAQSLKYSLVEEHPTHRNLRQALRGLNDL